jgi:hypothetical protein
LWYPVVVPKKNVCSSNLTLYQEDIRYGTICSGTPSSEDGGTSETLIKSSFKQQPFSFFQFASLLGGLS